MRTFKEIIETNEVENLRASAYVLGTEAFYSGKLCLPIVGAEQEFIDGYHDAKFLSNLERFDNRVAN